MCDTAIDSAVWLITGCSSGFGREFARAALRRGFCVVATARDPGKIAGLVAGNEAKARALALDVTSADQIGRAVAEAEGAFGRIDVLVNNAGYGYMAAVEEGEENGVRAQFETNFFGLAAMMRAVLPGMRVAGLSSTSARSAGCGAWPGRATTPPPSLRSKASRKRLRKKSNPSASM